MKNLKKGEIAVYALALMLVTAGYFNYYTFEPKTQETYSEDIENINEQYANIGDAVLVSNEEIENTNEGENIDNPSEDISQVENEEIESEQNAINETEKIAETKTANSETDSDESNYYANSKLDRDKMYAEMISNYEMILNNANASEAQKSIATQEISKINNTKNSIMICENLILNKGFKNCVILVNEASVNIIVNSDEGLQSEGVAKIQNIVSRELGAEIENIHITER